MKPPQKNGKKSFQWKWRFVLTWFVTKCLNCLIIGCCLKQITNWNILFYLFIMTAPTFTGDTARQSGSCILTYATGLNFISKMNFRLNKKKSIKENLHKDSSIDYVSEHTSFPQSSCSFSLMTQIIFLQRGCFW